MRIKDMKAGDRFYCAVGAEDMAITNCEWVVVVHTISPYGSYGGTTLCCLVSDNGTFAAMEYLNGNIEIVTKNKKVELQYIPMHESFIYKKQSYIKIGGINCNTFYKSFCLETGEIEYFPSDAKVIPIE